MRFLLIPSFNFENGYFEPYVPCGLLALQSLEDSFDHVTIDLFPAHEVLCGRSYVDSSEVVEIALASIDGGRYDGFGFSTVCNSVHYSFDIAGRLKEKYPHALIFFGGPYVTKLADRVLSEYPYIDAVFVGEGETSFSMWLSRLRRGDVSFAGLPGVTSPSCGTTCGSAIGDLDTLPLITKARGYLPWIAAQKRRLGSDALVPVEATRGCPLQCSFCSTKQVWGPKVRRKTAARLVNEMTAISAATGSTFFSLTGDNVGVPRGQFVRFCEEMIALGNPYTWACSLKLDRLTSDHLSTMWAAGCRGMFVGIETASQETLRLVNKAARLDHEIDGIRSAIAMGFQVETSFIIGFPWETEDNVRDTYKLHAEFISLGAKRSQLGILCPIPGTEIVTSQLVIFDTLHSSLAFDGVPLSPSHLDLVSRAPDLYSHFGRYETPYLSRRFLKTYRDAASHLAGLQAKRWRKERRAEESLSVHA